MHSRFTLLIILAMFLDHAKTARAHASAANSGQVDARAFGKPTKMLVKNMDKYDVKTKKKRGIGGRLWLDFGRPLASFGDQMFDFLGHLSVLLVASNCCPCSKIAKV